METPLNEQPSYDMEQQNLVEQKVAPLIVKFLKELFEKEPEDIRHLHLEVDFRVGNATFDLKADQRMHQTGNFFIETESVQVIKKGWLYNHIDYILYLDTATENLYMLNLAQLKAYEHQIKTYPHRTIKQTKDYTTSGHIVPIDVVCQWTHTYPINLKKMEASS